MTVAALVPAIAYLIYAFLKDTARTSRRGAGPIGAAAALVSGIALAAYVATLLPVLWLSRVREYHADRLSGSATGAPGRLARALAKIGYGLAGQPAVVEAQSADARQRKSRAAVARALGPMGIFDLREAGALGVFLSVRGQAAAVEPDDVVGIARWELWNPWARLWEFTSTHPRVAMRLRMLGRQAVAMRREPFALFDERKPEGYWDEFLADVLVFLLPAVGAVAAAAVAVAAGAPLVIATLVWCPCGAGLGLLARILLSHDRRHFPETNVVTLLKHVKVSGVRPVLCALKGRVIGRGLPGLAWSEDVYLRDETGLIYLDYRQPFRIWGLLVGLFRIKKLLDRDVEATGWYRRSHVPYVELNTMKVDGRTYTCYVYHVYVILGLLLVFVPLLVRFGLPLLLAKGG